jgi:3-methyladenine DNA glycosylase AlkD
MQRILERIRSSLTAVSEESTRISGLRFFKEPVKLYGVKTAVVSGLDRQYYTEVCLLPKEQLFYLCEELWKSGLMEESFIACQWSHKMHKAYEPSDFSIFEKWVGEYVTNWASCDTLCNHTVGTFLEKFPEFLPAVKGWAFSPNHWMRRAAAVSLIVPVRKGKFLPEVFEIAYSLLTDRDDLVQKGYGWMLKSASQAHTEEVFRFVMLNKNKMPRTALRYAIEKMPPELKGRAMAR